MTEQNIENNLSFRPVNIEDKEYYEKLINDGLERGCEYSFANVYLWGRYSIAFTNGQIVLSSAFGSSPVYYYPIGSGDIKNTLDLIIKDAENKGITCRINGISPIGKETIENLYPGKFKFIYDDNSLDYIYDINDLADLKGKKYHGKRNHLKRFYEAYPGHRFEPLDENNLPLVKAMVNNWYETRIEEDPSYDFKYERAAIEKAFSDYKKLNMECLVLRNGGEILAVTLSSFLNSTVVDVHFEKARADVNGAYAAINSEFAKYIRDKYPEVRFLNREEDMGIEGLRKAKQSYHPHHMANKCKAYLWRE